MPRACDLLRIAVAPFAASLVVAACGSTSPPVGPKAAACTDPVFQTSNTNGGWTDGDYYVHNNMWNQDFCPSQCSETLYACSYDNWYVVANLNDNSGDGAVKTYPNVHKDYASAPIG